MVHNPLIPVRPAISLGKKPWHFASNEELVGSLEPRFRPFFSADAVGPVPSPVVQRLWGILELVSLEPC